MACWASLSLPEPSSSDSVGHPREINGLSRPERTALDLCRHQPKFTTQNTKYQGHILQDKISRAYLTRQVLKLSNASRPESCLHLRGGCVKRMSKMCFDIWKNRYHVSKEKYVNTIQAGVKARAKLHPLQLLSCIKLQRRII